MIQAVAAVDAVPLNNANNARSEFMVGMRVQEGTKGNYRGKLNVMKIFLRSSGYNNCIDANGDIIVPLTFNIVDQLFGWLRSQYQHISS